MIRKLIKVESDKISISVPKDYIGKVMEVIAFSRDEAVSKEIKKKKKATFNAVSLDTVGFKFNREDANER
jgi:translation elongation factor EF-G